MAKESMKARDVKRAALALKYAKKRKELREARNVLEHKILNETYGNNWQSILL